MMPAANAMTPRAATLIVPRRFCQSLLPFIPTPQLQSIANRGGVDLVTLAAR